MRFRVGSGLAFAAILMAVASGAAMSADGGAGDLSLREAQGRVVETAVIRDAKGSEWQELVMRSGDAAPLRLRLGPAEFLAQARFTLSAGDEVRVRYFSAGEPPAVQRIRNQTTGQVIRLRCLHGEGFWDTRGHHGPGGHRHGAEGGPGPGGHGGPGGPGPRRGP